MKVEHREAIERARRHGIQPMVFAHELMVHDLVEAALFELRNIKVPFGRLVEDDQQEVIDRVTKAAEEAVMTAVGIISTRSVDTIPMTVVDAKFKAKAITVTASIDAQDPNRHGLIDVAGKLCLMVLAPADYNEGKDGIRAERDQRELPLSAGAIAEAMYAERRNTPLEEDEPSNQGIDHGSAELAGEDPLYKDALEFVIATKRLGHSAVQGKFAIGYNRAAGLLARMVSEGIVAQPEGSTVFELVNSEPEKEAGFSKEFGDFDYDDAKQLIVLKANGKPFKAHWVQSRLAVSSEQVTTLLMRLLDDKVIEVEAEGESALDHSYKVIATLDQVVA